MSSTIRIDEVSLMMLKDIQKLTGESKKTILQKALDAYQRTKIIEGINSHYDAIRANPKLWKEELEERALWEATEVDTLEDL